MLFVDFSVSLIDPLQVILCVTEENIFDSIL
jgi:hypothetical protein